MPIVTLKWQEGLYLQAQNVAGLTVPVETSPKLGGKGRGFLPSELLLSALGGCTAMDILSLLEKFNARPVSFSVELDGTKRTEHPKAFETMTAVYRLEGDITPEQAWKAVSSSYEKYSVVANTLKTAVDYRIILNGMAVEQK